MSDDATPRLRRAEWQVRSVDIVVARRLIVAEHYARRAANTAVYCHGLFRKWAFWEEECEGVAWWIPPTRSAAEATYPANWEGVLTLSRLAIRPDVPVNAASFLVGASIRLIDRERWPCLLTYADTMMGHTGAIYRATNWRYVGMTNPESAFSIKGKLRSRKRGDQTRTRGEMMLLGAVDLGRHAKHKFVLP